MHWPISQSELTPHLVLHSPQAFSLYSMSTQPPPHCLAARGESDVVGFPGYRDGLGSLEREQE